MLKSSIRLGAALMLLQAPSLLMALDDPPAVVSGTSIFRPSPLPESTNPSVSLRQAMGDPSALETSWVVLSAQVDLRKTAVGFRYVNETGGSVLLLATEPMAEATDARLYLLTSSEDDFEHTTILDDASSVRHVIKPRTMIELHSTLPGHTQSFSLIKSSGESFSIVVPFKGSTNGGTPELFPTFSDAAPGPGPESKAEAPLPPSC